MFPEELIELDRWCVWEYVERDGKTTKLPINPLTGELAKSNDESTWTSYEHALYAFKTRRGDGLGFFFKAPYIGIDLDNVEGEIFRYQNGDYENNIVHEFYETFKSYGEISPSGTGIHIIAKGEIPGDRRRKGNVEMYSEGRFFTMTENSLYKYKTVSEIDSDTFKPIYNKYLENNNVTKFPNRNHGLVSHDLSDAEVVSKILSSRQSDTFEKFLQGGWEKDYDSQSEADLAMANILAFWTAKNYMQMDRIFRESSLMRTKWDRKTGKTTYGQATLNRAINDTSNIYEPKPDTQTLNYKFGAEFHQEKKQKEYPPRSYDDTGNAERVIDRYGDILRYSYITKKFYVYNGVIWEEDNTGTVRALIDLMIQDMKNEKVFTSKDVEEDDAVANLEKHIKNSRSNRSKKNIEDELKHNTAILPDEFDNNDMLLNTKNGYLDLSSGELHEHDKEKMFSKVTNSEYTDTARPDTWISFLNDIFNYDQDMIQFIQKSLGYSLTGSSKEQVMFILLGNGRNGKSLFVNTISRILGDYATNMQADSLMVKRGGNNINNDIARLAGARFVTSSEPNEGFVFDEGLIKQMTGDDKITARFLHQENFEFEAKFKIWLATNHRPIVRGTDDGIWRRLIVIPFDVQIPIHKVDKNLQDKLMREAPAILDWLMEGCLLWQYEGLDEASRPQKIKDSVQEYRQSMDITDAFLEDVCELGESYEIAASEFYQAYKNWASTNNEYDVGNVEFGKRMKKKFESKKSGVIKYVGVRLIIDSRVNFIR